MEIVSCKLCGSVFDKRIAPWAKTQHHRKPKNQGGKNNQANISILTRRQHEAWNIITNANQMTPEEIAEEINNRYLDFEYEFICVKRRHDIPFQGRRKED